MFVPKESWSFTKNGLQKVALAPYLLSQPLHRSTARQKLLRACPKSHSSIRQKTRTVRRFDAHRYGKPCLLDTDLPRVITEPGNGLFGTAS